MSLAARLAARRAALTPAAEQPAPPPPSPVDARVVEPPAPPSTPLPAAAPASVGTGPLPPLDLGRPLRGCPVAVIDVETTGIDPREARIVEIAVVVCELGVTDPVVALHTRVKPGIPIPPDATKVHGIGDADVFGSPSWELVWGLVGPLLFGRMPVAFNAVYDAQVLAHELARLESDVFLPAAEHLRLLGWPWLDPFVVGRMVDQFEKGKKLSQIAERRGIAVDAHGAAGDAVTTALLLPRLLGEAARLERRGRVAAGRPTPEDLASVRSYLAWQRTTALAQERELVAFRQGQATETPWHALEGVEPPAQAQRTTRTHTSVARDGTVTRQVDDRGPRFRCRRVGLSVPVRLPESVARRLPWIEDGTEQPACDWELLETRLAEALEAHLVEWLRAGGTGLPWVSGWSAPEIERALATARAQVEGT